MVEESHRRLSQHYLSSFGLKKYKNRIKNTRMGEEEEDGRDRGREGGGRKGRAENSSPLPERRVFFIES